MKNLIVIVLVVALLGAGGWFYYDREIKPKSEVQPNQPQVQQETADIENNDKEVDESFEKNLLDLISSGKNQMCTYSYTLEDAEAFSGEVYVSGNNMRTNYQTEEGEESVVGSMIKNGDDIYIWTSDQTEGIKMKYDPEEFTKTLEEDLNDSDSEGATPLDPNIDMEYNCKNWTPDQAIFTPPSNVIFRDISALFNKFQDNSTLENTCEMCNSLEGENKETCLKQLNCGN